MMIRRSQLVDRSRVQYFHVVSRVVDRRLRLGDAEKNFFVRLIKRQEGFSGVEVMGYCVMGNHFHLLLRVPLRPVVIAEAEIWRRVRHIYSRARVEEFEAKVREWRESGDDLRVREFFDRLRARMYDLSSFVREVKLRFSKWYNRQNDRTGTLWEERFRSVVIEGREGALMTVLAYLDLNPVRAGIVVEPGGYRWSQYGEAMAGGRRARRRMAEIVSGRGPMISWEQACAHYRELLMERGGNSEESPAVRDGDKVQESQRDNAAPGKLMEKLSRGVRLSRPEILRLKVRYFSHAVAIGSGEFIREVSIRIRGSTGMESEQEKPGKQRRQAGHAFRHGEWGGLRSLRNLRVRVFGAPEANQGG